MPRLHGHQHPVPVELREWLNQVNQVHDFDGGYEIPREFHQELLIIEAKWTVVAAEEFICKVIRATRFGWFKVLWRKIKEKMA